MEKWTSKDGSLTLCRRHVEPIWTHIPHAVWQQRHAHELAQYRNLMGHDLPCEFCQADAEYAAMQDWTDPIAIGGSLD